MSRYKTIYERLDEYHARRFAEVYWSDEWVALRRQWAREDAAQIASRTSCDECLAQPGQPCAGMESGVHYARQLAYVRHWNMPDPVITT